MIEPRAHQQIMEMVLLIKMTQEIVNNLKNDKEKYDNNSIDLNYFMKEIDRFFYLFDKVLPPNKKEETYNE